MGVLSVWERVRLEIGALTIGDGCLGTFGLIKLYWTTFLLRGGLLVVGVTLRYFCCFCGLKGVPKVVSCGGRLISVCVTLGMT